MKYLLRSMAIVAAVALAAPAQAQYMWIDVDGDGDCDTNDVISTSTTSFDVWIDTDNNADGSAATCSTGPQELTINSYNVAFKYVGGAMTFDSWTDAMAFTIDLTNVFGTTEAAVGWGSGTSQSAGTYKLGTMNITVTSGNPRVSIITLSDLSVNFTQFGTLCDGADFDNSYKVNLDWLDVCGSDGITPVEETTWGKIKQHYR